MLPNLMRWAAGTLLLAGLPLAAQVGGGGGFGGPAVLGRPGQGQQRTGDGARISIYGSVQGIYDSGLTSVALNDRGEIPTRGLYGVEAQVGAVGSRTFKRATLTLNYQGDYRRYDSGSAGLNNFNGTTQFLNITYQKQVARRTTFAISGALGTSNLAYNNIFGPQIMAGDNLNLGANGVPVNGFFDIRTNFATGQVQMVFQHSARLSTSLTGGGFIVRRKLLTFADTDGATLRGDVAYRIGRRATLSADFGYQTYQFPRAFGDAHVLDAGLQYSASLTRNWQMSLRAGAVRLETLGSRQVDVDPAVAAITGFTSALEVAYTKNTFPSFSGSIARRFRRSSLTFTGQSGITPGNGLFLTSRTTNWNANYHFPINRRAVGDLSFGSSRFGGVGLITGTQSTYFGAVNVGYKLTRWIQISGNYMHRQAELNTVNRYNINGSRISFGVIFSPTELPISLW